jgi:hypothetical protein
MMVEAFESEGEQRLRPEPTERALIAEAFDAAFYLERNPELRGTGIDPLTHFLEQGWLEGRDPSPDFSVRNYLEANPNIARASINPFVHYVIHGRVEGRRLVSKFRRKMLTSGRPLVSVIVPNYNHARFLPERLDSIFEQTYGEFSRSGRCLQRRKP